MNIYADDLKFLETSGITLSMTLGILKPKYLLRRMGKGCFLPSTNWRTIRFFIIISLISNLYHLWFNKKIMKRVILMENIRCTFRT